MENVTRLRVLAAEDCVETANDLTMLLRLWGHDACAVYDGTQALRAALESPPDVLILDINMPGMDGFAVARSVRSQHDSELLMIVALTGHDSEALRQQAREAGMDHYLVKPVVAKALRGILS